MSGIHDAVMNYVRDALEAALITSITDDTRAGVIKLGPLQGEPDPDIARISVEVYENDPDRFIDGALSAMREEWSDMPEMIEIGNGHGLITWRRRFTAKIRCLFDISKENLDEARKTASTVRNRVEKTLSELGFAGVVSDDGEYVSRGIASASLRGETFQSGGPPDSYDFFIKFRFEVLTTKV